MKYEIYMLKKKKSGYYTKKMSSVINPSVIQM